MNLHFTNVTRFVILLQWLAVPGSEHPRGQWMDAFVWIWGLGSLRQKAKKGRDLSSCVTQCSLFGHALNTRCVQMSYKTDRYAHKTKSTFVRWPELYNSQCDVDFKYTLLTTIGQYAATHFTVCQTTTDKSVTVCGLLLATVSVFPHKSKISHFNGG